MTAELQNILSVSEQIVTGQSGSPVVKLIQDAVVVAFWLTQIDPKTHCPRTLGRAIVSQVAIDLPDVHKTGTLARLLQIREDWTAFRLHHPDHPTVRAMAIAGVDYNTTGYAVLSLCLPPACVFSGRNTNTNRLVTMYRRARHLPAHMVPIDVRGGLFLGGWLTSDTLTGTHGLLGHIYHHHGPDAGLRFLNAVQRLTTSISMYAYCPSIGLDDCLLRGDIRASARSMIAQSVAATRVTMCASHIGALPVVSSPYRVDGDDSTEVETGRLVSVRIKSEALIMQHTLSERTNSHWSPAAPVRMNQIALLCMLGTKGSVSNLVQCCHSVGRTCVWFVARDRPQTWEQQIIQEARLPSTDYDRVFPHDIKYPTDGCSAESRGLLWNESFIVQEGAQFTHSHRGCL